MGDTLTPPHNDSNENWNPGGDKDWTEIGLYGNNGVPRNRPNVNEWDPLKPKTNGMIITHQDSNNDFKVMCGGITYETNWDDLWPPVPSAAKPLKGACEKRGQKVTVTTEVGNIEYQCYVLQTKCSLQINCVLTCDLTNREYQCTGEGPSWREGKPTKVKFSQTRANFFTCKC